MSACAGGTAATGQLHTGVRRRSLPTQGRHALIPEAQGACVEVVANLQDGMRLGIDPDGRESLWDPHGHDPDLASSERGNVAVERSRTATGIDTTRR